jgi:membrane protease YdiL (CAAX protease family)
MRASAPPDVPARSEPADPAPPAGHRPAPTPGERVTSLLEVILCSGYPTQIALGVLLIVFGLGPLHEDGTFSLAHIALLSLGDTVVLVGLAVFFLVTRGERPADVFVGPRRPFREALLGVLLIPLVFAVVALLGLLIQHLAPWLRNVPDNPLAALLTTPASILVMAFVVAVAGGIREEIQRAFILHRFEQHLGGAVLGLILFSAAFGAGHLLQGRDAALMTGALGLLWGVVYLRRRSVVAPVVSHAAFNLIQVLYYGMRP